MSTTIAIQASTDVSAGSQLALDVARTREAVQRLARDWNGLHAASVPQNPFVSFYWAAGCLAHVHTRCTPFVITARDRGALVGVAALYLEKRGPFRVLRFIGDGKSDYLGFLRSPDHPAVVDALVRELHRLGAEWDLAFLRRLSPAYGDRLAEVPEGVSSRSVEGDIAPQLSFSGGWEELLRSGPSQLRHTQRWVRKFEREGGVVTRVTGSDARELVHELAAVEADSWKGRRGVGWFVDPANRRLLWDALSSTNAVQIWLARFDGQAIAFLVNFVTPERVMYYQGAYRDGFRRYYPGGVLHFHAMRAAWQSGLREYDFLIGTEEYKTGWSTGVHTQQYVALFPSTARGRLAFSLVVAPRWYLRQFRSAHTLYEFWRRRKRLWSLSQACAHKTLSGNDGHSTQGAA